MANNWLITGTSSGFGRTLTELALERGDNVVATVRKPSRSPAGPNSRARRAQLRPVIGLGQRTGCDADRSHGAIRPLLDVRALKSSTLERNSFRIGDLFALL